ncbi:hypothetical protein ACLX1H_003171 [Fusarium chlamydosporum]
MFGPEIGLASWAAVDIGLRWSNELISLCRSIKNASIELSERVNRVETAAMRISLQMEYAKQVVATMEPEHRQLHLHTLKITLTPGGSTNTPGASALRRPAIINRTFYALKKGSIDESIKDLETWQSTLDISWLLILKIADQTGASGDNTFAGNTRSGGRQGLLERLNFNKGTDVAVFLQPDGINISTARAIPHSEAKVVTRGSQSFILDTMICASATKTSRSIISQDVKRLAQRLHACEGPDFGLFGCKGVVKHESGEERPDQVNFTFVFRIPQQFAQQRSLRGMLLNGESPRSLSDVVILAQQLAKAVSYVHLLDFVHKNINPESILLLTHTQSQDLAAYLVGFQKFRKDGGMTSRLASTDWEQVLYCHPRRYGSNPEDAYIMQHDIYSLGVCLLEIGLWESFVVYSDDGQPDPSVLVKDYLPSGRVSGVVSLKQQLVALARTQLPRRIGSKYAHIVETCLTCLDEGNEDFGDDSEFLDEDGILVGVRYIEKVGTSTHIA